METGKFDRSRENLLAIFDDKGEVTICPDTNAWREWTLESFNNGARWVGKDELCGFMIWTVFLGINQGIPGTPIWFETKVFRSPSKGEFLPRLIKQFQYTTKIEAVVGHAAVCEMVRSGELGG